MKKLLLFVNILMLATLSYGQSYGSGIGLKSITSDGPFGGFGINYKTAIGGGSALDLTVGGGSNHLAAQLLYEWQKETGWTNGLDWYIGVGGTLGAWSSKYYWNDINYYDRGLFLAADAVIGLDFNLKPNTGVPIIISLEAGPSIGVINSRNFRINSALILRYIIN